MELRHIFFLCGMGYMIDLLYAQAFGLVEPALKQELGFSSVSHTSIVCNELLIDPFQPPSQGISSRRSMLDYAPE